MNNLFTTIYHPQAIGLAERFNCTILVAIHHYIGDHSRDWYLYSEAITYAYNSPPHSTTGLAPFELVLARSPTPLSIERLPSLRPSPTPKLY